MAGSIVTVFKWSIFRVESIVLIALWALNPLGSQASFRGIYLRNAIGSFETPATFYDPDVYKQMSLAYSTRDASNGLGARELFLSALYDHGSSIQYVDPTSELTKQVMMSMGGEDTAIAAATRDLWGNVRIPSLEYHRDYNPQDPHRWLQVPWTGTLTNYSSLVGNRIDFNGIRGNFSGNASFHMPSSYQSYKVSVWIIVLCCNEY